MVWAGSPLPAPEVPAGTQKSPEPPQREEGVGPGRVLGCPPQHPLPICPGLSPGLSTGARRACCWCSTSPTGHPSSTSPSGTAKPPGTGPPPSSWWDTSVTWQPNESSQWRKPGTWLPPWAWLSWRPRPATTSTWSWPSRRWRGVSSGPWGRGASPLTRAAVASGSSPARAATGPRHGGSRGSAASADGDGGTHGTLHPWGCFSPYAVPLPLGDAWGCVPILVWVYFKP